MLSIDEEILKSGPYVANYRDMFLKTMRQGSSSSTQAQSVATNDQPPEISQQSLKQPMDGPGKGTVPDDSHRRFGLKQSTPQAVPAKDQPLSRQQTPQRPPSQLVSEQRKNTVPGPENNRRQLELQQTKPLLNLSADKQRPEPKARLPLDPIELSADSADGNVAGVMGLSERPGAKAILHKKKVLQFSKIIPKANWASGQHRFFPYGEQIEPEKSPNLEDKVLQRLLEYSFPEDVLGLPMPVPVEALPYTIRLTRVFKTLSSPPEESDDDGLSDLCQACEDGNLKWAKYLIEHKIVSPDNLQKISKRFNGKNPLHIAVEEDREDMVNFLLEAGVPPNITDIKSCSPFLHAVEQVLSKNVSVNIARLLLNRGADIGILEKANFWGGAPLARAVRLGNFELVELLLTFSPNRPHIDDLGEGLLLAAVSIGRADLVKLLVQHGCKTTDEDSSGRVPLVLAIVSGRRDITEILLQHNASKGSHHGLDALSVAVRKVLDAGADEDLDVVRRLIDHDDVCNGDFGTAPNSCRLIQMAIAAKHVELTRLLARKHQAWQEHDNTWRKGQPTLSLAVSRGDSKLASILVHVAEAAIDERNEDGVSPLLLAVRYGNADMVSVLLETNKGPQDYHGNCGHEVLGTACCLYRAFDTKVDTGIVIRRLLRWGLPVDGVSSDPLEFQGRYGQVDDSACRADFHDISIKDYTALHIAARRSARVTSSLLFYGANASSTAECTIKGAGGEKISVSGVTPLHLARGSSAKELLTNPKSQANVFAKDSLGRTPLFWAATEIIGTKRHENLDAVTLNLEHGSPVNLRDCNGCTPLGAVALKMARWTETDVYWPPEDKIEPGGKSYRHSDPGVLKEWALVVHSLVTWRAKVDVPVDNTTDKNIKDVLTEVLRNAAVRDILLEGGLLGVLLLLGEA